MKKLLVLELNELNFEFVEHYARRSALPAFARLLDAHGYARTRSETVYEHIEPWIQWFTVHTGKPFDEHKMFRLGDGPQSCARQIWEELAQRGLRVGAFSPMNAGNAVADAAFFVPDPWTKTSDMFDADREHLHYYLIARGYSVSATVAILMVASAITGAIGIGAWQLGVPDWVMFYLFAGLTAVVLWAAYARGLRVQNGA